MRHALSAFLVVAAVAGIAHFWPRAASLQKAAFSPGGLPDAEAVPLSPHNRYVRNLVLVRALSYFPQ